MAIPRTPGSWRWLHKPTSRRPDLPPPPVIPPHPRPLQRERNPSLGSTTTSSGMRKRPRLKVSPHPHHPHQRHRLHPLGPLRTLRLRRIDRPRPSWMPPLRHHRRLWIRRPLSNGPSSTTTPPRIRMEIPRAILGVAIPMPAPIPLAPGLLPTHGPPNARLRSPSARFPHPRGHRLRAALRPRVLRRALVHEGPEDGVLSGEIGRAHV